MELTTFYKNFVSLCAKNGLKPSGVAQAIGLSNAAATGWKKGKMPNDTTREKLANYFHVTVAELMGDDCAEKETAAPKDDGLSPMDSQLMEYIRALTDDQKRLLLAWLKSLKDQEWPVSAHR